MMMMLVPCVCVNRRCAVIKRFRRFVVEKASSSFPLFSVFWQTKSLSSSFLSSSLLPLSFMLNSQRQQTLSRVRSRENLSSSLYIQRVVRARSLLLCVLLFVWACFNEEWKLTLYESYIFFSSSNDRICAHIDSVSYGCVSQPANALKKERY